MLLRFLHSTSLKRKERSADIAKAGTSCVSVNDKINGLDLSATLEVTK
ncbi:MAG: hypothetical protein K2L70_07390 [Clostridia bacterium]|nr:hypothetical protein [Clostridia bacterium]